MQYNCNIRVIFVVENFSSINEIGFVLKKLRERGIVRSKNFNFL